MHETELMDIDSFPESIKTLYFSLSLFLHFFISGSLYLFISASFSVYITLSIALISSPGIQGRVMNKKLETNLKQFMNGFVQDLRRAAKNLPRFAMASIVHGTP